MKLTQAIFLRQRYFVGMAALLVLFILMSSTQVKAHSGKTVEEKIIIIIADNLGIETEDIKTESRFIEDLGADELDSVEFIMSLEEIFEMSIPDEAADKITTVGEAIEYIKSHMENNK